MISQEMKDEMLQSIIDKELEKVKDKWLLRMASDSFIMIVSKEGNIYKNLYASNKTERKIIQAIASRLDKHKNMK